MKSSELFQFGQRFISIIPEISANHGKFARRYREFAEVRQRFPATKFDTMNMIKFQTPERTNLVTTMQKLHSIRLRGPWQFFLYKADGTFDQVRQPLEQELPPSWREGSQEVTAKRKFNCPRNLSLGQRVFIQIQSLAELGEVQLNDVPLVAAVEPGIQIPESKRRPSFDGLTTFLEITSQLEPFNELRIDFSTGQIDLFTGLGPIRRVDLWIDVAPSNG